MNLQRIPLVDTSNPFSDQEIPDGSKSILLLEIKKPEKLSLNRDSLKKEIPSTFFSGPNSVICPGNRLSDLLITVFSPLINRLAS